MYIFKQTTFDGAPVDTHRIARVEIQGQGVTVLLYSINAADPSPKEVFRSVDVPMEAFCATAYPESVANYLVGDYGPLMGGSVHLTDDLTIAVQQERMKTKVDFTRDGHLHGGINYNGLNIQTDEVSLRNIMGTAQMATLSKMNAQPFSVSWRCADNTATAFDADGFIAMATQAMQHVQGCYQRSWELKEEIEAATDQTTLDGIAIDDGWPA